MRRWEDDETAKDETRHNINDDAGIDDDGIGNSVKQGRRRRRRQQQPTMTTASATATDGKGDTDTTTDDGINCY